MSGGGGTIRGRPRRGPPHPAVSSAELGASRLTDSRSAAIEPIRQPTRRWSCGCCPACDRSLRLCGGSGRVEACICTSFRLAAPSRNRRCPRVDIRRLYRFALDRHRRLARDHSRLDVAVSVRYSGLGRPRVRDLSRPAGPRTRRRRPARGDEDARSRRYTYPGRDQDIAWRAPARSAAWMKLLGNADAIHLVRRPFLGFLSHLSPNVLSPAFTPRKRSRFTPAEAPRYVQRLFADVLGKNALGRLVPSSTAGVGLPGRSANAENRQCR